MEINRENEREIIKKAKNDPESFGIIYDAYYQKIFRFIFYRTSNRDVAEDLTAETFFQALKNLWRFRFTRHPFSAWLYRIAMTQVAMYYREKKKYCELTSLESPELLHNNITSADFENLKIDKAIELKKLFTFLIEMKEEEQNIIVLRYFEEMSMEEISRAMNMKINTVKSHLRRGLGRLRKYFQIDNIHQYDESNKTTKEYRRAAEEHEV